MKIVQYEETHAAQIAALLNAFLPFELETTETVDQAGGIRFVCLNDSNEIVGYIAGYIIEDLSSDFPYSQTVLSSLLKTLEHGVSIYTSHFVVHPACRNQGIGTKLVQAYMQEAETMADQIVVVGWVQSDTNTWEAEHLFKRVGFEQAIYVPRYFEPYEVDCPSCQGICYCDANILLKHT